MKKYRNAKGQFVGNIGHKVGSLDLGNIPNNDIPERFNWITDIFTQKTTEKAIRWLLNFFSMYDLQKILSIHPYFKDKL
ncbi:MAG: hypothetical protein ACXACY_20810 [Candidatus Hodarchaeales archaeon]|jgi:hypothetical protein